PAAARDARRDGAPARVPAPVALDLARAVARRGDAPGHAGGGARHHGGRRGAAPRGGLLLHPPRPARGRGARARGRPRARPGPGRRGPRARAGPSRTGPIPRRLGRAARRGDATRRGPRPGRIRHERKELIRMRIAMVTEHASPLAALGGVDAGGQNVHVLELGSARAGLGHDATVWTRRDDPALPDAVPVGSGVVVRHVPAGPPRPVPKDELVPHLPAFTRALEDAWTADPPDIVHAHFWMSGMAALAA